MQINLQHSRTATDSLMQAINRNITDIVFIQEPYIIKNKVAGISRDYRIFTSGEIKLRAAILNKQIDAILINQLADDDVEIIYGNLRFYAASMYLDIEADKIDKIIMFTKGSGLLYFKTSKPIRRKIEIKLCPWQTAQLAIRRKNTIH